MMADYEVTSPDGKKFRVTAPEGATQEQVLAYAQENFGKAEGGAEPSYLERAGRVAGLGARTAITNIAAIPALLAEAPAAVLRTGIRALTGKETFPSPTATLQQKLTEAGLPEPQTGPERFSTAIAGGLTGTGTGIQVGKFLAQNAGPVVSRIGSVLSSQPAMQTAGAVTGATASQLAQEAGAGPVGQLVAGVAGGLTPTAVTAGVPAAARWLVRGGEEGRQRVAENIRLFEESGYGTPSAGQASESRVARGVESTLAKTPGGAGRMISTAEKGAGNLGATVETMADTLAPGATGTRAGMTIEKGIKGFIDRFKAEQGFLYDKIDPHIAPGKVVDVSNTRAMLRDLTADIPGARELSKWFQNAKIKGISGALDADALAASLSQNQLPYEALKKLRTLVGKELENVSLTSDVPRSQWKALYGALSEDMRAAAQAAGPDAVKAFERANAFTSAGHTRIETFLDRVLGKDTVEKVFQSAVNPSEIREGASTINAVMRSLAPSERQVVQAAFLKRLGIAGAGKQDAAGEVFSPETFLTNWNKISPEAKLVLFAGGNGKLRSDLDKIAKVAQNLREGSQVFANPSGTGQAVTAGVLGGGALLGVLMGDVATAAKIGATVLSANVAARVMTNPTFVRWLAQNTATPTGAIPIALQQLAASTQNMPEDDRAAVHEFIEKARGSKGQP